MIAVVLCVFNESGGIEEFLTELNDSLSTYNPVFFVVDDCSTDKTLECLQHIKMQGKMQLFFAKNERNLGHGASTYKALKFGLDSGHSLILSVDGDGQFIGNEITHMVGSFLESDSQVAEGCRTRRTEPQFRKIITWSTRIMVWSKCRVFPKDANTPLRIYRSEILNDLLKQVQPDILVPNLMFSWISRIQNFKILEFSVTSIPRRGDNSTGTSWGKSIFGLPSLKFIRFCKNAGKQWLKNVN